MNTAPLLLLERLAAVPVTAMWLLGVLAISDGGLPAERTRWYFVIGGIGLLALWVSLCTSTFEAWPKWARLLQALGLLNGVCLAVVLSVAAYGDGGFLLALVMYGCALVPGCRHFFRAFLWLQHRTVAS